MSDLTFLVPFQPMHDFSLMILPGAFASSVAVSLDILAAAAALAPRVGAPTPRWRTWVPRDSTVELAHGLSIAGKPLPKAMRSDGAVWIVPGLGLASPEAIRDRLDQPDARMAIAALKRQANAGATIAASCTGVFLLQAAGLLAGKKVSTSWWLASHLQRLEPDCAVDANRMVIADGSIVTAGAALSQTDLMLHLLRARFGVSLADAVCRALVIDRRQSQAPYIVPALLASGHDLIAKLTTRIATALPHPPSISSLAREFCISERTLARHVHAATGRSPMDLVQSVRLNKARALLESSKLSVQQVAERVGYSDATALRRLMRRVYDRTPGQLRRTKAFE